MTFDTVYVIIETMRPTKESSLLAKNPELAKEWHPIKNGDLTPATIPAMSNKKVWWRCKYDNTHEWEAPVANRNQGRGCPICANRKLLVGYNDLATVNPELTKEWHPTKNGDLRPKDVIAGARIRIWWRCKYENSHEWEATLDSRNGQGVGCPECVKWKRTSFREQAIFYYFKKAFDSTINSFEFAGKKEIDVYIKELKIGIEYDGAKWHNNKNKQDLVKSNLCKKLGIDLIRIREHGNPLLDDGSYSILLNDDKFSTLEKAIGKAFKYVSELRKVDCEVDIDIERDRIEIQELFIKSKRRNSLFETNPKLASEWHPTKNGSLTTDMVRANSHIKHWWLGKCGHEWDAPISHRNKSQGCPICANKRILVGFNDFATTHPALAAEWHPTKNKEKPTNVFAGSVKKVWWQCKHGHEWPASLLKRSHGKGCPYCSGRYAISGETDLATKNPELAKEWHPTKNGLLKPSDVKPMSHQSIWWLCKCGHEWELRIDYRATGSGCPKCARERRKKNG